MDRNAELTDIQNEISDLLGGRMSEEMMDDVEAEEELDRLMGKVSSTDVKDKEKEEKKKKKKEMHEQQAKDLPIAPQGDLLPAAPTGKVEIEGEKEEVEVKKTKTKKKKEKKKKALVMG